MQSNNLLSSWSTDDDQPRQTIERKLEYRSQWYSPYDIYTEHLYSDGHMTKKVEHITLPFSKTKRNLIQMENFYEKDKIKFIYHYDNGEKEEKIEVRKG